MYSLLSYIAGQGAIISETIGTRSFASVVVGGVLIACANRWTSRSLVCLQPRGSRKSALADDVGPAASSKMPMPGKFTCHHDGCTLLERHPGLCVFANISTNRGRRDSTHERTAASTVQAAQPAVKRKVPATPKLPCAEVDLVGESQRGSSPPTPACASLVQIDGDKDAESMVPPRLLNSMGPGGAMDPNFIPFPDCGRGVWQLPDGAGRTARGERSGEPSAGGDSHGGSERAADECVGVLRIDEGNEPASGDGEARAGVPSAVPPRKRPRQHKPWTSAKRRGGPARQAPQPSAGGGCEEQTEAEPATPGAAGPATGRAAAPRRGGAWVGQAVDVPMAEFEVRPGAPLTAPPDPKPDPRPNPSPSSIPSPRFSPSSSPSPSPGPNPSPSTSPNPDTSPDPDLTRPFPLTRNSDL